MRSPDLRLSQIIKSGEVPHALLFAGSKGSGKKEAALNFAATLLASPKKLENHPDLHLYFPEGKIGLHPIEAIRKLSQEAALAPYEARLKIFILHDAEKMLPTSSNALLKTLEEPPPNTLIILLSDHPTQLLPTILSRCQLIEFPPAQVAKIDPSLLALLASDSPREKLSNFECENPNALFETLLFWYRDRLLIEMGAPETLLHFPTYLPQLKQTPFIPLEEVEKYIKQIRLAYDRSTKLSTCLEMFFLFCG